MQVHFNGISKTDTSAFEAKVRALLSGCAKDRVQFAVIPETVGEVTVMIQLEGDEKLPRDTFDRISLIVNNLASSRDDAKCSAMNGGDKPFAAWHRWSSGPNKLFWK